jgi:hypothetical protein
VEVFASASIVIAGGRRNLRDSKDEIPQMMSNISICSQAIMVFGDTLRVINLPTVMFHRRTNGGCNIYIGIYMNQHNVMRY